MSAGTGQSAPTTGEGSDVVGQFHLMCLDGVDHNRLVLSGEFDLAAESSLRAALCLFDLDRRPTIIDCGAVTFIDCAGLRCLLADLRRRPLDRLIDVPDQMTRLLSLTGLFHELSTRCHR